MLESWRSELLSTRLITFECRLVIGGGGGSLTEENKENKMFFSDDTVRCIGLEKEIFIE